MTKVRPPLTFENALTKVAGVIGWAEAARICGFAENTVRNWSDQDTTAKLPLEAAFRLDVAFQEACADGVPFLSCYATRLKEQIGEVSADRAQLLAGVAAAAREGGEAVAATIAAAKPDATHADFAIAERELEEAITASRRLIVTIRGMLRKLTHGRICDDVEEPPEGFAARDLGGGIYVNRNAPVERAPEVAPPNTS